MFARLLRKWFKDVAPAPNHRFRPRLDELGERIVPATYVWQPSGAGTYYANNTANWLVGGLEPNTAPGTGDNLVFGSGKSTCQLNGTDYKSIDSTGFTNTIISNGSLTLGYTVYGSYLTGGTLQMTGNASILSLYGDTTLQMNVSYSSGDTPPEIDIYGNTYTGASINVNANIVVTSLGEWTIQSGGVYEDKNTAYIINHGEINCNGTVAFAQNTGITGMHFANDIGTLNINWHGSTTSIDAEVYNINGGDINIYGDLDILKSATYAGYTGSLIQLNATSRTTLYGGGSLDVFGNIKIQAGEFYLSQYTVSSTTYYDATIGAVGSGHSFTDFTLSSSDLYFATGTNASRVKLTITVDTGGALNITSSGVWMNLDYNQTTDSNRLNKITVNKMVCSSADLHVNPSGTPIDGTWTAIDTSAAGSDFTNFYLPIGCSHDYVSNDTRVIHTGGGGGGGGG